MTIKQRGRTSINVIVQVPKTPNGYGWKLVSQLSGQRSARLRFRLDTTK